MPGSGYMILWSVLTGHCVRLGQSRLESMEFLKLLGDLFDNRNI